MTIICDIMHGNKLNKLPIYAYKGAQSFPNYGLWLSFYEAIIC